VLHPTRYYGVRDVPQSIALGGTEGLAAAGFTCTVEDTMGELHLRVLAGLALAPDDAARVAAGWGGDRLRAFARGDDLLLVWLIAWDSDGDAAEFAEALPGFLPGARVERRDDRVLVLVGPAAGGGPDLDTVAQKVWARSRVVRRAGNDRPPSP
jgi:hypothetical protein